VTTQVDNFIYTGTKESMEAFAHYMKSQFQLSELEFDNFSVFGTRFTRDNRGITMSQGDKINDLKEFSLSSDRRRMHEEPTTRAERLFYMSTVGSILFVGQVTSPIASRTAGILASALSNLCVKDIKCMNAAIRKLKARLPAVAELVFLKANNPNEKPFWLNFSDASFHEDVAKNRSGVLITRAFGLQKESPFHVIDFCSHRLRRVARSTKTAETLAASEAYDRAYYCRALAKWMSQTISHGLLLVLDNSSLYSDVSTTRSPKEKRLKVDLALLREAFETGALSAVIWAETSAQLADAMTKEDEKSDIKLLLTLSEGVLRYAHDICSIKILP
jgi:hypothetical protein